MLDTLAKFLNVRTETGRKYVQQIKAFKKDYIYDLEKEAKVESLPEEKNIPIEKIIISLAHYYSNSKDKTYNLENFKKLFTIDEIYDKVIGYFQKEIDSFRKNQNKSITAIDDMNILISEALEIIKTKASEK